MDIDVLNMMYSKQSPTISLADCGHTESVSYRRGVLHDTIRLSQ